MKSHFWADFFETVRTTAQIKIVLFILLLCVRSPVCCAIRRMVARAIVSTATSHFVREEFVRAFTANIMQATPAFSIWIAKFIAVLPFQLPIASRIKRLSSLVNKALGFAFNVL